MLQERYLIPIKRSFLVFINFSAALKSIILICIFVLGRNINCDWAISKSKFCEKLEKVCLVENQETDKNREQSSEDTQKEDNDIQEKVRKEKDNLKKQKRRRLHKIRKQKKRARIVIRNLAFEVLYIIKDVSFSVFLFIFANLFFLFLYRLQKII